MSRTEDGGEHDETLPPATLLDALLVYAEPLAENAYVLVIGDSESSVAERLLALGARGVQVFDPDPARAANAARIASVGITIRPLVRELDVRDGSFDVAIIPDLSELNDPRGIVGRLPRALGRSGSVIALGRSRSDNEDPAFVAELGPATLGYDELYDVFATSFPEVSLAGVVPFRGVVFAELGGDEAPAVSVDTRFAAGDAPDIFVVAASKADRPALDAYAIVQLPAADDAPAETSLALEAALAAAQIKAELAAAQLEETRDRLVVADVHRVEGAGRLERAGLERDAALTRAMELEAVLGGTQQTIAMLEQRVLIAEQGAFQRGELVEEPEPPSGLSPEEIAALVVRVEESEAALVLAATELSARTTDLAQIAEVHGAETAAYEAQLQDRARVVASLEKELDRREQLVRELIASVEGNGDAPAPIFEQAPPVTMPPPPAPPSNDGEVAELRAKLDVLAAEIARRDGELTARKWRIEELEVELARRPEPSGRRVIVTDGDALGRAHDEIDALRQALAQEHAARIALESGETLAQARAELARQATLLEQVRRERRE